jgi:23S rRNA pseudouridine1911/1915/1917 synthase
LKISELKCDEANLGQRLDLALSGLPEVKTRSQGEKLIAEGRVFRMHGGKETAAAKGSYRLQEGDVFRVHLDVTDSQILTPLDAPLDIVYQDKDLLVINKPAGLVVHPAAGHAADTLVNILVHHVPDLRMGLGELRPGIVHRLDKGTSGLLVVAKTSEAQLGLVEQFQSRSVERIYWAIVYGTPKTESGRIESHLARHPTDRKRYISTEDRGKIAITNYQLLAQHHKQFSLLKLKLETGRTHQIRVHMAELGHAVVGDETYGRDHRIKGIESAELRRKIKEMNRLALHAKTLGFVHPITKVPLSFERPFPEELRFFFEHSGWNYEY